MVVGSAQESTRREMKRKRKRKRKKKTGLQTKTDSGGRYTCFVEDEASFLMHGKPFGLK
ncbi:hypothetical protein F2Q69_00026312 [Brassica cretica]|uniref:Uncharacterized protein n=1 Tax=Brassica cretica TaxID=69181 RepID=A0A8S9RZV4_BRACR|nr:hypothetical protein F2Q69_00026312 [Brassica cretica]